MEEWKICQLGDVVNLKRGYDLANQNRVAGLVPIFSSSGITDYHVSAMKEGPGVITGRYGTIGKVFYTENPYWPLNTTLYVQDFKGNHPKFIFYFLQGIDYEKYSDKSAVPGINRNDIHSEIVAVPPLSEQTAIASILSSLDDKIDLLHRQNKTLEGLAEVVFREWFVVGAKEEWETMKISDVAKINAKTISKNYPFGEIEYLDTGSITNGHIEGFQIFKLVDAPSRAQRIVEDDDIVYSLVRPIQRHYGIFQEAKPNSVASTGFCVISCDKISPHFIYVLLTLNETVEFLDMVAEGSTSAYPSLKPSDIANFEFQMPPKDLLFQFSSFAKDAWNKIKTNTEQIRTLTQTRDGLLPRLMSGEVRVGVSEHD